MESRFQVCDACGGDGGGDYCSGHYGGEPVYQWVKCAACEGTGKERPELTASSGSNFYFDLDEEIPFLSEDFNPHAPATGPAWSCACGRKMPLTFKACDQCYRARPAPQDEQPPKWVSATCEGERCAYDDCRAPAFAKVGEEIPHDDPYPARHNLTAYICEEHFVKLMGQMGAHFRMRCIENRGGPSAITHALLNKDLPHD